VEAGFSTTRIRDTASTAIYVLRIVENAANGLVGALALTFIISVVVLLLYIWSIPDRPTSVSVTAFVGLATIFIIYKNNTYIVLPRSVVPIPSTAASTTSFTTAVSLPGIQLANTRSMMVDFFSNTARPALHNIDREAPRNERVMSGTVTGRGVTFSRTWRSQTGEGQRQSRA
jgi:hypothetical protein